MQSMRSITVMILSLMHIICNDKNYSTTLLINRKDKNNWKKGRLIEDKLFIVFEIDIRF